MLLNFNKVKFSSLPDQGLCHLPWMRMREVAFPSGGVWWPSPDLGYPALCFSVWWLSVNIAKSYITNLLLSINVL